tara:strand:- start:236 stop:574 length:339 start_codon:yes stop_codon:yes gene_type:complete
METKTFRIDVQRTVTQTGSVEMTFSPEALALWHFECNAAEDSFEKHCETMAFNEGKDRAEDWMFDTERLRDYLESNCELEDVVNDQLVRWIDNEITEDVEVGHSHNAIREQA